MAFYLYLAVILLLLSLTRYARNKVVYTLVCVALFFIAAYREIGVGTDSVVYYYLYYLFVNNESYVTLNSSYKVLEITWLFILKLCRNELGYRALLVILEILIAVPLFYAIRKQSKWPMFSLFLYVALFFYATSMNLMRQSIAMSFFLLSISFLIKNKNKNYWGIALLSTTIHMSSIFVFTLTWFIKKAKINFNHKTKYLLIIIASFILGVFLVAWLKDLVSPIANFFLSGTKGYSYYISGGEANVERGVLTNGVLNLMLIFLLYKHPNINNLYFKLYFCGLILSNLIGGFGDFSGRIVSYFTLMEIIVFPDFIYSVKHPLKQKIYTIGIIIFAIAIYIFSLQANYGEIIPYSNIYF